MNIKILEESFDFSQIKESGKSHIAIICHDQPDPDCFATALGMKEIADSLGFEAAIFYGGEISHTQTRVMINVLNISAVKLDPEDDSIESIKTFLANSYIVVVDTPNFGRENCQSISDFVPENKIPDLIIDHHIISSRSSSAYIHKNTGSCSTIMFEILKQQEIEIGRTLATALYLGISTDTDDLRAEGTTNEDREVFEQLKCLIDPDIYLKIFNYPKPPAMLGLRSKAYRSICVEGNLAITQIGLINPQQRALLGELCEEVLEIDAIETVVVMGIVDEGFEKDKYITASFRSRVLAIDTRDFMQRVFGKKYAGGRKGCGAAKVPLDDLTSNTIDRLSADELKMKCLNDFMAALFETYKSQIRQEKEKI